MEYQQPEARYVPPPAEAVTRTLEALLRPCCADEMSHVADIGIGITGFMYGCAVGMLAACWKHGEELRQWHNLKTQIRDEGEKANQSGGVLNPAVINIGSRPD